MTEEHGIVLGPTKAVFKEEFHIATIDDIQKIEIRKDTGIVFFQGRNGAKFVTHLSNVVKIQKENPNG